MTKFDYEIDDFMKQFIYVFYIGLYLFIMII